MSYNVQTSNLTFVDKRLRCTVHTESIAYFQVVSDTMYNMQVILCFRCSSNKGHDILCFKTSLKNQVSFNFMLQNSRQTIPKEST